MTKYVRETKHGKSIRALVILNKKGEHVATVQASFSDNPAGSVCLLNVWNHGDAQERCERTKCKGISFAGGPAEFRKIAHDNFAFQSARAGGYGYDKFASALSGLMIDGIPMTDHCGGRAKYPKGLDYFPRDYRPAPGYRVANYKKEKDGYSDCYREPGLEYLRAIGYRVIEAI